MTERPITTRSQTPTFSRSRAPRTRERIEIEASGATPIPGPGDDEDDEPGWLRSVVPAPLRPAADRVADLGVSLLGGNASLLVRATQAFFGFCVWYTVLHGFFGVSRCFGQAGHATPAPDLAPPVYHAPSPLGRPEPDNDGDASGEVSR